MTLPSGGGTILRTRQPTKMTLKPKRAASVSDLGSPPDHEPGETQDSAVGWGPYSGDVPTDH
jgi:hypothetical protein